MSNEKSGIAIMALREKTILEVLARQASPGPVMVNLQPDGTTTYTVRWEWIESLAALVAERCAQINEQWDATHPARLAAEIRAAFPMPKD